MTKPLWTALSCYQWRNHLKIVSAVSEQASLQEAILEVCDKAKGQLEGNSLDLAILFISPEHVPASITMPGLLHGCLNTQAVVGCSGSAVISTGKEHGKSPTVVLAAAHLNKVQAVAFEMRPSEVPNSDAPPEEWRKFLPDRGNEPSAILMLPDPYTMDSEHLLVGFDYGYPETTKFGGLVSGMKSAGAHTLFIKDIVRKDGMVGIAFYGDVQTNTIVSHGCRPVGPQMVITSAKRNSILGLDGKEPVKKIGQIFDEASHSDQNLMRKHLQIGFPIDPLAQEWHKGDFVIRNVIGINGHEGSIKIGAAVRNGQVVQFHVLDADYAKSELDETVKEYLKKGNTSNTSGALLFSCVTRIGGQLFKLPNQNVESLQKIGLSIPVSGVFSNGQISSYSVPNPTTDGKSAVSTSILHGYTSAATIIGTTASTRKPKDNPTEAVNEKGLRKRPPIIKKRSL